MRAVLCEAYGPPESLVLREAPDPTPGAGEVVVDVAFAALNFFDTLIIRGKYQIKAEPPFSPAAEFSGRVVKIGPGVEGFSVGERVAGYVPYGAARERLSLRAEALVKIPDAVSDETAASLFVTYGTTLHALRQRADLKPGEALAVLGASGGVGLAAVELGKIMGARVVACASSPDKLALAARHGADALIDYAKDDLKAELKRWGGAQGIDVVYDPVGGALSEAALRAIAWKGRFLVIGFASGEIPRLPLNLTLLKGCDVLGVFWSEFVAREPAAHRANMAQLLDWAAQGLITAHVHAVRPFAEAGAALEEIAARRAQGKILLRP